MRSPAATITMMDRLDERVRERGSALAYRYLETGASTRCRVRPPG